MATFSGNSRIFLLLLLFSKYAVLAARFDTVGNGRAMKQPVRSSSKASCEVGLARTFFLYFQCVWRPAKFSLVFTLTVRP